MLLNDVSKKGKALPDIARESRSDLTGRLDRVGMGDIEVPVLIFNEQSKQTFAVPAKVDAMVSLDDPFAKGIHMSRLYLHLQEKLSQETLSFPLIGKILKLFVSSHVEISEAASLKINFEYMTQRPSLKSENLGWRSYPMFMAGQLEKGVLSFELGISIAYSSTCPCSAALARKLIQEGFRKKFSGTQVDVDQVYDWLGTTEGVVATPHSQRSYANVKIKMHENHQYPQIEDLIDLLEKKLATPVQAAVKREDEQEFALLNGQNLMFCEDAARKLKAALSDKPFISDFYIKVRHVESLHPHDAVAVVTKGVKNGYKAES